MLNFTLLTVLFRSILGEVTGDAVGKSFELMGAGMLGIFIVMILIYLVIVILHKATDNAGK